MLKQVSVWAVAGMIATVTLTGCDSGDAGKTSGVRAIEDEFNPRGQILALSCASCHGTDGKSVGIMPGFYGKSQVYLENALKQFKNGERYSTVMERHAKGYTDEEITLIAEYFGWACQQTTN
ncbi:c-type cytochrome [Prosthecochloris vibrioformis]|uniref:Sulfide dehydrogenase n=1 Tax=Prosthecochloris vibrioformis TaxID=1098 RepID=A0A5C4S2E4_PROVB|nr:c-type cytochrome [Prosthecochloris vibrioformis]TNJ37646.1 sulfide dehydrogenase [Prosthecochloris vibrioformis]